MREVELKARVSDYEGVKAHLDSVAGPGRTVEKRDHYFRIASEERPSLRIRNNNGILEFTAKKDQKRGDNEDNLEYEFNAPSSELEDAVLFFHALGYHDYFLKIKNGFDWTYKDIHIELLNVNDLGWFLELEALLPFDSGEVEEKRALEAIYSIFNECSVPLDSIEKRSYRSMILDYDKKIVVYTDGGAKGNPGPGGWAYAIFIKDALLKKGSGGEELTTNNRMELIAVISALEYLIDYKYKSCEIKTDSQYVKNGITDWIEKWKRNGWKSASGMVKNKDLWVRLDELVHRIDVKFSWVKGHSGVEGNEICDSLVKMEFEKFSL